MEKTKLHQFDLCGGHVALDFVNTLSQRLSETPREHLTDYEELLGFAEQSSVIANAERRRLAKWGRAHEVQAERIRVAAVELREALHGLFTGVADSRRLRPSDLAVLNRWIRQSELGESLSWQWAAGADAPDAFLGPIVRSAVDLLTSPRAARVKVCEADDCAWLFHDASKNGSRRWCDMNQCGNRVKARRFYERTRRRQDAPPGSKE
jgi:predicted RNA-binding Zn ribbon-like protein